MIKIDRLTYRYPHTEKPALTNLSLTVNEGECVGILGRNGAGKSSLCYAVMGLIPHFYHGTIAGDVWVKDINVPDANLSGMSHHVGLVFQNPENQISGAKLTVAEEIAFGLENMGVPRKEMLERIDWVAATLRLENLLDRNPYHLSGGQMQRVAIASVLVLRPDVLVMDEPTSQLDPSGTEAIYQVIDTLRREGVTILLVEHKVELMAELCDRMIVMDGGELKLIGTPREVFSHPSLGEWGVEAPVYTRAYRAVRGEDKDETAPVTLTETVERLKHDEQANRR